MQANIFRDLSRPQTRYVAVAAGGLSAKGWPRVTAKLGRPIYGDVIAIFALPDQAGK